VGCKTCPNREKVRGEKLRTENRRKAGHEFFLSKFHIELKGQVFDRNQWNLWTFASLGIFSLHVPCTSMAWKSVALPYDFQMRYRSTGHLTTYDIFRYFYRFPDRMRPCDIGGRKMGLSSNYVTQAGCVTVNASHVTGSDSHVTGYHCLPVT
jgi:hypothetical protein